MPSDITCGSLTAFQSSIWKALKKVLPGFIQGLTKNEMLNIFKENITTTHESISIDGSAFDSGQKAFNMS